VVGAEVGAEIGDTVEGTSVVGLVGTCVCASVGATVGAIVGSHEIGRVGESVGATVGRSVGATVGDTVGDLVGIVIAKTVSLLTTVSTAPESDWPPMVMSTIPLDMAAAILRNAASSSTCSPNNSVFTLSVETDDRRVKSQTQLLLTPPAMSSWLTIPFADAMKNAR
jgi:hypothetical protein